MRVKIIPATQPITATVQVPGSKSITNRAMLLAALSDGYLELHGALHSEDTQVMRDALVALGIPTSSTKDGLITVQGQRGRIPYSQAELFVGNAGTAARFLTAAVCLGEGSYEIDGVERMRQRPIGELLDTLRSLGAVIEELDNEGVLPIKIQALGLLGGEVTMRGAVSSQFISAIMISAPYAQRDTHIKLEGPIVSRPFLDMTLSMMHQFGVRADWQGNTINIPCGQSYRASMHPNGHYNVEPDATAASYFWAAAALTGGDVCVPGIPQDALQGDVQFVKLLSSMGCSVLADDLGLHVRASGQLKGINADMGDISDTFLTLAAIAPFASSPVEIRGVEHSRKQECDRISAVCTELKALGAKVEEHADGLKIWPSTLHGGSVKTYHDHRMAMAFSLIGLRVPDVVIEGAECVNKTFPDYWQRLSSIAEIEVHGL
ncbi:MAG: 3-phosphoshikimate 1-carboxyvinyltransferase [Armatimonadota bacterium]